MAADDYAGLTGTSDYDLGFDRASLDLPPAPVPTPTPVPTAPPAPSPARAPVTTPAAPGISIGPRPVESIPAEHMKAAPPATAESFQYSSTSPQGEKVYSNNGNHWYTAEGTPYVAPLTPAQVKPPQGFALDKPPSTMAALGHAAERQAVPILGSLGVGTAAGLAAAGLAGPAAPVAGPVVGALAGIGSAIGLDYGQEKLLSMLPDKVLRALGQDPQTRAAEQEAHPGAVLVGENLPWALTMRPGGLGRTVFREGAGPAERFFSGQVGSRVFGAGVMGGATAGQELAAGEPIDPLQVGTSALMGGVFNKPWGIGNYITNKTEGLVAPWIAPIGRATGSPYFPPLPPKPGEAGTTGTGQPPPGTPGAPGAPTPGDAARQNSPEEQAATAQRDKLTQIASTPPSAAPTVEDFNRANQQRADIGLAPLSPDQFSQGQGAAPLGAQPAVREGPTIAGAGAAQRSQLATGFANDLAMDGVANVGDRTYQITQTPQGMWRTTVHSPDAGYQDLGEHPQQFGAMQIALSHAFPPTAPMAIPGTQGGGAIGEPPVAGMPPPGAMAPPPAENLFARNLRTNGTAQAGDNTFLVRQTPDGMWQAGAWSQRAGWQDLGVHADREGAIQYVARQVFPPPEPPAPYVPPQEPRLPWEPPEAPPRPFEPPEPPDRGPVPGGEPPPERPGGGGGGGEAAPIPPAEPRPAPPEQGPLTPETIDQRRADFTEALLRTGAATDQLGRTFQLQEIPGGKTRLTYPDRVTGAPTVFEGGRGDAVVEALMQSAHGVMDVPAPWVAHEGIGHLQTREVGDIAGIVQQRRMNWEWEIGRRQAGGFESVASGIEASAEAARAAVDRRLRLAQTRPAEPPTGRTPPPSPRPAPTPAPPEGGRTITRPAEPRAPPLAPAQPQTIQGVDNFRAAFTRQLQQTGAARDATGRIFRVEPTGDGRFQTTISDLVGDVTSRSLHPDLASARENAILSADHGTIPMPPGWQYSDGPNHGQTFPAPNDITGHVWRNDQGRWNYQVAGRDWGNPFAKGEATTPEAARGEVERIIQRRQPPEGEPKAPPSPEPPGEGPRGGGPRPEPREPSGGGAAPVPPAEPRPAPAPPPEPPRPAPIPPPQPQAPPGFPPIQKVGDEWRVQLPPGQHDIKELTTLAKASGGALALTDKKWGFHFKDPEIAEQFAALAAKHLGLTPYGSPHAPDVVALSQAFADAFAGGRQFRSIVDARKFAADLLGGEVTGEARKALDEAIELGVTRHARTLVAEAKRAGASPQTTYDQLVNLYKQMPLLYERTSDSLRRQAYSTPAPIAYVASRLADVGPGKAVYEPTAGNGILLLEAPKATLANEIDPARRAALQAQGFLVEGHDAAAWAPGRGFDVVLANPPFGKSLNEKGLPTQYKTPDYTTEAIDHAIAFKSLEAMKDDGTAVLIVGSKKGLGKTAEDQVKAFYNSDETRRFFRSLYSRYNVTDHFTVSGDLYNRQGAAWPIDVIVIRGRGKSRLPLPTVQQPRIYETFDQLRGVLDGTRRVGTPEDRPGTDGGRGGERGGVEPPRLPTPTEPTGTQPHPPGGGGTGGAGHPGGIPGGQPGHPGEPTEPVGGGDTDGGRAGTRPVGGGDTGPLAVPGAGERPGGGEGAGERPPTGLAPTGGPGGEPRVEPPKGDTPAPQPPPADQPKTEPEEPGEDDDLKAMLRKALERRKQQQQPTPLPPEERPAPQPQKPKPEAKGPGGLPRFKEPGEEPKLPPLAPPELPPPAAPPRARPPGGGGAPRQAEPKREPRRLPPEPKTPEPPPYVEPTDEGAWKKGLGGIFGKKKPPEGGLAEEEKPPAKPPSREWVTGVEPEKYEEALPFFKQAVQSAGGRPGQDIQEVINQVVDQLLESGDFDLEDLEGMQPYLLQFMKDVRSGNIDPYGDVSSRRKLNLEPETDYQVKYFPASESRAVGTLVPVNMQTAITHALEKLRGRVGEDIDQYVADKLGYTKADIFGTERLPGILSAEQVDADALAINNLERGAAFINGDQTGVGKGRFLAALIRYAQQTNRIPVFVTREPGLYADMYRDLNNIGIRKFNALVTNNDLIGANKVPLLTGDYLESLPESELKQAFQHILVTGKLPRGYDALFTTYSQMQPYQGRTARHDVLERLAPNSIVIFDEAHEAGGTAGQDRRKRDPDTGLPPLTRASFARDLVKAAQAVAYASGTFAKAPHVMDLYSRTDLRYAVGGAMKDVAPLMERGGVPLQAVAANMLAEAGQYVRRERSYEGIDMPVVTVPVERETAEDISSILRGIFQYDRRMEPVREALGRSLAQTGDVMPDDPSLGEQAIDATAFASIMHHVIGLGLLSAKADHAADAAIAAYHNGEKPIIALANTNESILDHYIDETGTPIGRSMAGLTFRNIYNRYLDRTRTVRMADPYDSSKKIEHYIDDEQLRELGFPEMVDAYDEAKELIEEAKIGDLPVSPIDHMIERMEEAGMRVGEITGRQRIIRHGDLTRRVATPRAKKDTINEFNGGNLDALVINRSGATGYSLHASSEPDYMDFDRKTGAKIEPLQRHMILLQHEPNISMFMQMLGRVHRTGQVVLPRFSMMTSDLPAELRPLAILMKKMAALNANISANHESAVTMKSVPNLMNHYGDYVIGDMLSGDFRLQNLLGIHPNEDGGWPADIARRATGRLSVLPIDEQGEFWDRLTQAYNDHLENMNRLGLNTLEARLYDLDAQTVSATPIPPRGATFNIDSPFAQPAMHEIVNMRRIGNALTLDEIKENVAATIGGRTPEAINAHLEKLKGEIDGRAVEYLAQLRQAHEENQETLAALKGNPEAGTNELVQSAIKRANEQAVRSATALNVAESSLKRAKDALDIYRPLRAVDVKMINKGEKLEDKRSIPGIIMGLGIEKRTRNPLALSNFVVRVAVADGAREFRIPLSRLASEQAEIKPANAEAVQSAFNNFQHSVSRETRSMVTGNLLAGFDAFHGRGQIMFFTDADGNVRQGVLLPRDMDVDDVLSRRPVQLPNDQVLNFLDRVQATQRRPGVVWNSEANVRITRPPNTVGKYLIVAEGRGRKQYMSAAVDRMLADAAERDPSLSSVFRERKGGTKKAQGEAGAIAAATKKESMQATTDREGAQNIIDFWGATRETYFLASADQQHARDVIREAQSPGLGEERTPEAVRLGPPTIDRLDDFHNFALNNAAGPHQQAADWTVNRGATTGHEHLAIVDPATGQVTHAVTSELHNQVGLPRDALPQLQDENAGLVAHHNHPRGTALSRMDIAEGFAHRGIAGMVAHGKNGEVSIARLTPETLQHIAGMSFDDRSKFLRDAIAVASKAIKQRLDALVDSHRDGKFGLSEDNAQRIHADLVNQALDAAGLIDYVSSHESSVPLGEPYTKSVIRDGAQNLATWLTRNTGRNYREGQVNDIVANRSTRTLRPGEGIGSVLGEDAADAARPVNTSGDRGNRGRLENGAGARRTPEGAGGGQEVTGRPGGEPGGLAEEEPAYRFDVPAGYTAERQRADLDLVSYHDRRNMPQRVRDWFENLKQDLGIRFGQATLDEFHALAGAEKMSNVQEPGKLLPAVESPSFMARISKNVGSMMETLVGWQNRDGSFSGGAMRYSPEKGIFETLPGSKGLEEGVFSLLRKYNVATEWANWKIANRADRLMREGREQNVPREFISKYKDSDHFYTLPDGTNLFRQIDDNWMTFNRQMLDLAEDRGVINAAQRKMWENSDYIPFYRALEDDRTAGPGAGGRGIANVRSPIQHLYGSKAKIADIYDNMYRNTQALLTRTVKNEAMRRTVDRLSGTTYLTPLSRQARIDMNDPEVKARLRDLGIDPDDRSEYARTLARNLFGLLKSHDPNVVSYMKNGVPQYFKVENPLLLRSLVALGPSAVDGIERVFAFSRKLITTSTMIDPAFQLAHFMRMSVHGWGTNAVNSPITGAIQGAIDAWHNSPSAMAMMAAGAGGGTSRHSLFGGDKFGELPRNIRRLIEAPEYQSTLLNTARKIRDFQDRVGRASDMGVRVRAYDEAIAAGLGEAEAMRRAQDVLNYGMRGDNAAMQFLTSTVPFLNARIQGIYRAVRGFRDNPGAVLTRGALTAAASIALWYYNHDDPEYQAKEDWDKQYAWQFKVAPGVWARLPKPFEFGAIFGTIPEMVMDYFDNGSMRQFGNAFASDIINQLKADPVPSLLRPLYDLATNRDHFSGRPIENPAEQGLEPFMRFGPSTSPAMVAGVHALSEVPIISDLANMAGLSPDRAEFMLRGFGGAMAGYILSGVDALTDAGGLVPDRPDPRPNQYPVVGPIIGRFLHFEPTSENRFKTDVYEMERKLSQIRQTAADLLKQNRPGEAQEYRQEHAVGLALYPQVHQLTQQLATVRRAMAQVSASDLSSTEKRQRLDAMTEAQNRIAARITPILRRYEGLPVQ